MCNRLKIAGRNQPENPGLTFGLVGCKSETQIPENAGRFRGFALHELKNRLIQSGARISIVMTYLWHHRQLRLQPAPFTGPQISRVNAIGPHQFLNIAVLWKQGYGRNRLVGQYALEVFSQCKTGVLDFGNRVLIAKLGLTYKPLHGALHGPEHQCRLCQANHLEGTDGLVKLLPRDAQLAGVYRGQVGTPRHVGVPRKALECLGSTLKRLAKLVEHPSQRAQVIDGEIRFGGG